MHKFLSKLYKVVGVEFGDISRNFEFLEIKTLHALNNSDPRANKAGVYIHYTDECIFRNNLTPYSGAS